MDRLVLAMIVLWVTMMSVPAAAVPLIHIKLDLYGSHAHANERIGEGNITLAGFPAGFTDPWFFDGPGELKKFSFDSLPGFPGQPWHYGLDNLLFEWGTVATDADGIVSRWEFQTDRYYAYGVAVPGTVNQLRGRWFLGDYGGTLRGRTVPEPGTVMLLLIGMLACSVPQWRRRRQLAGESDLRAAAPTQALRRTLRG
jgi:hypothetical protein